MDEEKLKDYVVKKMILYNRLSSETNTPPDKLKFQILAEEFTSLYNKIQYGDFDTLP